MVGHLPPGQYPRQSFERVLENTLVESEDDLSSTPDHFAEAECQIRPVLDRHPAEHATFYFRCSFQICEGGPQMVHAILRVDGPTRPAPNRQKLILVGSSAIVSNGR
jgi:hypothetical protein